MPFFFSVKMSKLSTHQSRIGLWKGSEGGKRFFALTNFSLKFLKFVKAPEQLPNYAGFIVKVIQPQGDGTVEGSCFLPWYHVANSEQLCATLGTAIPSNVLSSKLNHSQIKDLLMQKWDDYSQQDETTQYLPVVCTGRQPNSDTFVVGPELQFDSAGCRIPDDAQQYIWIPEILRKLHADKICAPLSTMPSVKHPLRKLLRSMSRVSGDNFIATLYMLSGAALSIFYQKVQALCGSAAIHLAVGGVSRGKSIALKLVLAACCNYPNGYQTRLSESMARRYLSGALPFGYDDPENDEIVKQLLINAFGGAGMGNEHLQIKAMCTPLITANRHVLEQLSAAETRYLVRAVIVPFKFHSPQVEIRILDRMIMKASASFPQLLTIGEWLDSLTDCQVSTMRQKVLDNVQGVIDSRLATQYALTVMCAQMLLNKARYVEVTKEEVLDFFENVVAEEIISWQGHKHTDHRSLGQAIFEFSKVAPRAKVLQVINPNVVYRPIRGGLAGPVIHGVAVSLKEFFKAADTFNIEHEDEKITRQKLRGHPRCDSRKKQYFNIRGCSKDTICRSDRSSVRCITCICLPKDEIPDSFFELMNAPEEHESEISYGNIPEDILSNDDFPEVPSTEMEQPELEAEGSLDKIPNEDDASPIIELEQMDNQHDSDLCEVQLLNDSGIILTPSALKSPAKIKKAKLKKKKIKRIMKKTASQGRKKTRGKFSTPKRKQPAVRRKLSFKTLPAASPLATPPPNHDAVTPPNLAAPPPNHAATPPNLAAPPPYLGALPPNLAATSSNLAAPSLYHATTSSNLLPPTDPDGNNVQQSITKSYESLKYPAKMDHLFPLISPKKAMVCTTFSSGQYTPLKYYKSMRLLRLSKVKCKIHVPRLPLIKKSYGVQKFKNAVQQGAATDYNKCQKCYEPYFDKDHRLWVGCDSCPRWYHWKCLGYKRRPSTKKKIPCKCGRD